MLALSPPSINRVKVSQGFEHFVSKAECLSPIDLLRAPISTRVRGCIVKLKIADPLSGSLFTTRRD